MLQRYEKIDAGREYRFHFTHRPHNDPVRAVRQSDGSFRLWDASLGESTIAHEVLIQEGEFKR